MNLAQDLGGDGRVEVDGVVPQALRRLVALPAATLEGLPHPDLRAVAVLGVVLDAVHILRRRQMRQFVNVVRTVSESHAPLPATPPSG